MCFGKNWKLLERQTETFELQIYIDMNFEGLKDDVLSMIAGNPFRQYRQFYQ